MIKSYTKLPAVKVSSFPKLMISTLTDMIVLFYDSGLGTVINEGRSELFEVGEYHGFYDTSEFEDYNGEVVLKNI